GRSSRQQPLRKDGRPRLPEVAPRDARTNGYRKTSRPPSGAEWAADSRTRAHRSRDGDVFNFNLAIGRTVVYRIFQISKQTGKTTVLATINGATAAYLHSFFLTKYYVILCVWNSHFSYNGISIPWNRNILDSIAPFDAS